MLFSNKTLLVLGTNVGSKDIVEYAKSNGAFTIVTDYLSIDKSEAKKVADLALMVSTDDLDELERIVEQYRVDGVIAGISEFNLIKAMELSERCGLEFYCNHDQWRKIENKGEFRALCNECGVPTPKTFFCGKQYSDDDLKKIEYPVVVKPVDSCASQGVHFCFDEEQLVICFNDARKYSISENVIIEQYVEGEEFTAHYTIVNEEPCLTCVDNRYPVALHEGAVTTIPIARIYPSTFLNEYLVQVDEPMKELCKWLGLKNAVLFVQGIHTKKGEIYLFEAGLRSAAEMPNRFLKLTNGIDYLQILVEQVLLKKVVSYNVSRENPNMSNKTCAIVSYVTMGGVVGRITGLNMLIEKRKSIIDYEVRYQEGVETPCGDTLRQIMLRFLLVCENRKELTESITFINQNVNVYDANGCNMVIKMDPNIIII